MIYTDLLGSAPSSVEKTSQAVIFWAADPLVAGLCPDAEPIGPEAGDRLEETLGDMAASRVAILCLPPEKAIVAALQQGDALPQALLHWATMAREVLRIHCRHRRQIRIVDPLQISAHPERFATNFGAENPVASDPVARLDLDPVLLLIAQQALREDRDIALLAGEFEASMLNLTDDGSPGGPDAETVCARYRQLQADLNGQEDRAAAVEARLSDQQSAVQNLEAQNTELSAKAVSLETLATEGERKRSALQVERDKAVAAAWKVEQESEKAAATLARTEDALVSGSEERKVLLHQIGELSETLVSLEKRRAQSQRRADAAERENDALKVKLEAALAQSASQSADLENSLSELSGRTGWLEQEQSRLQAELEQVSGELGRVRRSKSYRLMAPARKLRARMGRGNKRP